MKNYIIKHKKLILFVLLYIGLFRLGIDIFHFSDKKHQSYIDYAGLIANTLFCLACFWELYCSKRAYKI
jgi:hypothetical protein